MYEALSYCVRWHSLTLLYCFAALLLYSFTTSALTLADTGAAHASSISSDVRGICTARKASTHDYFTNFFFSLFLFCFHQPSYDVRGICTVRKAHTQESYSPDDLIYRGPGDSYVRPCRKRRTNAYKETY